MSWTFCIHGSFRRSLFQYVFFLNKQMVDHPFMPLFGLGSRNWGLVFLLAGILKPFTAVSLGVRPYILPDNVGPMQWDTIDAICLMGSLGSSLPCCISSPISPNISRRYWTNKMQRAHPSRWRVFPAFKSDGDGAVPQPKRRKSSS